ncbi:hypothetical protein PCASD_01602 [Puccinia coronata f. sp. avenae]|uniref:Uncharacterized protein n=1 Tax=Puccinia coronata f. sp. avenae TaxID=200324 RepID=A0A2N5VIF8_9BASI|nr:hypothetical protein PCASD_01602 [Puccinia coronata f. sp. avenae]
MTSTNSSQMCNTQAGSSGSNKENNTSARGRSKSRAKKLLMNWNATFASRSNPGQSVREFRNQAGPSQTLNHTNLNVQAPQQANVSTMNTTRDAGSIPTNIEESLGTIQSHSGQQTTTYRRSTRAGPCALMTRKNRNEQVANTTIVPTRPSTFDPPAHATKVPKPPISIEERPEKSPLHECRSTRAGRPKGTPYTRPEATSARNAEG